MVMKFTIILFLILSSFHSAYAYTITGTSSEVEGYFIEAYEDRFGSDQYHRYYDGYGEYLEHTIGVSPENGENDRFDALISVHFEMSFSSRLRLNNVHKWGDLKNIKNYSETINLYKNILLHYDGIDEPNFGGTIFENEYFSLIMSDNGQNNGDVEVIYHIPLEFYIDPTLDFILIPINPAKYASFSVRQDCHYSATAELIAILPFSDSSPGEYVNNVPLPSSFLFVVVGAVILFFVRNKYFWKIN